MTDNYRELIEEARHEAHYSDVQRISSRMVDRLADAIEALLAERDAQERLNAHLIYEADTLAAQIAAAKRTTDDRLTRKEGAVLDDYEKGMVFGWEQAMKSTAKALSADPAELLRGHDAKVWDEGFGSGFKEAGRGPLEDYSVNPYRKADDD